MPDHHGRTLLGLVGPSQTTDPKRRVAVDDIEECNDGPHRRVVVFASLATLDEPGAAEAMVAQLLGHDVEGSDELDQ